MYTFSLCDSHTYMCVCVFVRVTFFVLFTEIQRERKEISNKIITNTSRLFIDIWSKSLMCNQFGVCICVYALAIAILYNAQQKKKKPNVGRGEEENI